MTVAYISGPMSGYDNCNRDAFDAAATELVRRGYDVRNPATVEIAGGTWEDYMRADIAMLMECDCVFVLPGWEASPGATVEVNLARNLNIPVFDHEREWVLEL